MIFHVISVLILFILILFFFFFFFNDTATTEIYTLSLHDALPISVPSNWPPIFTLPSSVTEAKPSIRRSEEHTSELQSRQYLVCRLLLEKKKKKNIILSLQKKKKFKSTTIS